VIDYHADGSVQIVRQSNMQGIVISLTEWGWVCKVMELHDWPIAPPTNPNYEVRP
jgi:hypothetical protein